MARVDQRLIDSWERERHLMPDDGAERLSLIEGEITILELELAQARQEDKFQVAIVLRELYWKYLTHARQHWASSPGYQTVRARVMDGLKRIEALDKET